MVSVFDNVEFAPSLLKCIGCGAVNLSKLLDFGPQPPSNRFLTVGINRKECHPLKLGQCISCGLVQLIEPMHPTMVCARYDWIKYNEPEGHLDQLVDHVISSMNLAKTAKVMGLTYKDDSTIARFQEKGFLDTYRFSKSSDFGIDNPLAGLESIQSVFSPKLCKDLIAKYGRADILVVRHVLEHAHKPLDFLKSLMNLVKPEGFAIFEIPDSFKLLESCDYSFIWEEHVAYFTLETARRLLQSANLSLRSHKVYSYSLEDSLVLIVSPTHSTNEVVVVDKREIEIGDRFGKQFSKNYMAIRSILHHRKSNGEKIALFGAGHLATKFLNLFGLENLVTYVIDDDVKKVGLRMPGSEIQIVSSHVLQSEKIDLCLLAVSPENQAKILASEYSFIKSGGRFMSIFSRSQNSIWYDLAEFNICDTSSALYPRSSYE